MVMGFALTLGDVLGKATDSVERRTTGLLAVSLYIGLVVANFVYLWPILTAMPITPESWQSHLWLPSWK
jgi:dolichyl-phosphate-mannose--protein O-mannosyl transferase